MGNLGYEFELFGNGEFSVRFSYWLGLGGVKYLVFKSRLI